MSDEKVEGGKLIFKGKSGELAANVELSVADIKKYIAPKASDAELFMFVNIARSQGLNPFMREIHFVPFNTKDGDRWVTKHSIVVGYEVYLKRVLASGLCEGFKVEIENEGADDETAVYTGYRKGWKEPFIWRVKTNTYAKEKGIWLSNRIHMIKKIAASQGMRWQFADVISGMPYTMEEVRTFGAESGMLDITNEAPQVPNVEEVNAESALEDLKPAAPEPAPTTAADLEVKLAGLDVGVPATSGEEVSARLTEIYRSTRITPENIEEAIRITGYNVGDDPANIRASLNSKKPNDHRQAIGVLLNWWKE